ncbi:DUF4416 family protein [Pirellulales bacterium]|nr:DUF4416 family protein [Pirellulales bacterium]
MSPTIDIHNPQDIPMGAASDPTPVLRVIAASSRYDAALDWGREKAVAQWGRVAAVSDAFNFGETDYYEAEMGVDLKKQFWAFALTIDPGELPAIKLQTNQWEVAYAALEQHQESRPLNLDPGYVTLAKLVLASTKDHAHRIYLADGIYAETTLNFRGGGWQPMPWTYPDYRRDDYQKFLTHCRDILRGMAV